MIISLEDHLSFCFQIVRSLQEVLFCRVATVRKDILFLEIGCLAFAIVLVANIGSDFEADTYTWFGRLSSRVTVFKKIDLQINYNYRAPRETTQGRKRSPDEP